MIYISRISVCLLIVLASFSACQAQQVRLPPPRPLEERAMEEITPAGEFFVISAFGTPKVDVQRWRLDIGGMVNRRVSLSLDDLNSMKQTEHVVTVECIENPAGGNLIGTGRWSGVLLSDLLVRAGVRGNPRTIAVRALDASGNTQPPIDQDYRDGNNGIHTVTYEVAGGR